jgi:20S proteasome subunit alpha 2
MTSLAPAKDGVVIASEKKLHPLVLEDTVHKIANITDNIGMVYSGIGPDFRVLVRKARKKAQAYYRYYKEQISVNRLVREVATIMQEYTQSGYVNRCHLLKEKREKESLIMGGGQICSSSEVMLI